METESNFEEEAMRDARHHVIGLLTKNFESNVGRLLQSKDKWNRVSQWTESIGQMIAASGVLLSFASGFFDIRYLSFVSGSINVLAIALLRYSKYAEHEMVERTETLNQLLEHLSVKPAPMPRELEGS